MVCLLFQEREQVAHSQITFLIGSKFGGKYGPQRKTFAVLGIVRKYDAVCFRLITDYVDTRYFTFADRADR